MPDKRIPEFPDSSDYGDLAPGDFLLVYMSSVNKTAKLSLLDLISYVGATGSTQLEAPGVDLDVVGDDAIDVNITPVAGATSYRIYRTETTFADKELLTTTAALIFNDTALEPGTLYKYFVQAIGGGYLDSTYGSAQATTTGAGVDTTPPLLSSAAVNTSNPSQIILTYNETLQTNSSAATSAWSMVSNSIVHAAISGTTVTLTLASAVSPGQTLLLSYSGSSVKDTAGNLAATFTDQSVTNGLVVTSIRLSTPSNFKATPVSPTEIDLEWDDIANEDGLLLERLESGGAWEDLATLAADTTSYNDTGRTSGTLYFYRLTAIGDGTTYLDSISTTASATTPASSGAEYDTILTFVTSTQDSDANVNATSGGTSSVKQFQFNAIPNITGAGMRMTLREEAGTFRLPKLVVDFPSDYLGQPFKYIHSNGAVYVNNFTNGNLDFDLE